MFGCLMRANSKYQRRCHCHAQFGGEVSSRITRQRVVELEPLKLAWLQERAIVLLSESYHRCQISAELQLRLDRRGRLIGPRSKG